MSSSAINIWYDSNLYFGRIGDLKTLLEAAVANTSTEAPFRTIEEFLTRSRKHSHPDIKLDYGTRSEHSSDITLKDYLEENGKLEEFLELWKNLKD
ncbi:MAG: hypothetical protein KDH96_08085 [Candidatus Riesia sp.]|nr:hypothetical protein [Candidatus Riesia sp.]